MALTYTTGMTLINNADSVTNWAAVRFSGTGGAPSASLDTTVFIEGAGAIGMKSAGNNWNSALMYDWYTSAVNKTGSTTVDLTATGNEVVGMWVQYTTPSVALTVASGGMYIILSSSADSGTTAPSVYSEWYVYGSATYPGGWVFLMLDTRKTPTGTTGGGCNLAAVRRIGFGSRNISSVGTVKADNLFMDALWYGRPRYQVIGDGTTTATWALMQADSASNVNNLIQDIGGAYVVSCGLRIGSSTQSATTTFADATGKQIIFKRYTYYSGGTVDALNYSDYYILSAAATASFNTSISFGSVVGSGDERQGVLGGGFRLADSTNMTWSADFATYAADFSSAKFYGCAFVGAKGGMTFDNDGTKTVTDIISPTFINCGEIDLGTTGDGATLLNFTLVDPSGGTSANRGLLIPNGGTAPANPQNIKNGAFITSGAPTTQHMVRLNKIGTYTTTFDGMKFFGDYSSGTLWHGENSASANATVSGINGTNDTTAEWENTGASANTVAVNNVSLTVTIKNQSGDLIPGAQVSIFQDDASRTVVLASTATDENGEVATTVAASLGAILIRVRQSTNTLLFSTAESTTNGIDSTNDRVSTLNSHRFQSGDAVVYSKNGGSASIGLSEGTTYYVNAFDSDTVTVHATAAQAIAGTSVINLTASGTETHELNPIRYINASAAASIGSDNFTTTITLVEDIIAKDD